MNPTPTVIVISDDESQSSDDYTTLPLHKVIKGEKDGNEAYENKLSELEDVDDDCLMLDGDPYKTDEQAKNVAVDEDDLLVTGETGQVACRDYPHSRHMCIKFPFGIALHTEHCDLCHCYVCDSPAPCPYWGTGLRSTDHCHATDAVKGWKTMRARLRKTKLDFLTKASTPPTNMAAASCHGQGQVGRATAVRAWTLAGNSVQMASSAAGHSQVSRPAAVQRFWSYVPVPMGYVPVQMTSLAPGHSQVGRPAAVRACSSSVPNTIGQCSTPRAMDIQYWRNGPMPPEPALGATPFPIFPQMIRAPLTNQMFHGSGALSTNQAAFGTNQVQKFVYHGTDYAMNHQRPWLGPMGYESDMQRTALSNEANIGSATSATEVYSQRNIYAPPHQMVPLGYDIGDFKNVGVSSTIRDVPLQQNVDSNAVPFQFIAPRCPWQSKVPRVGDQTTNATDSGEATFYGLPI
ncbi:RPM1 interacting protein 13 [Linum grandiflorum]